MDKEMLHGPLESSVRQLFYRRPRRIGERGRPELLAREVGQNVCLKQGQIEGEAPLQRPQVVQRCSFRGTDRLYEATITGGTVTDKQCCVQDLGEEWMVIDEGTC